MSGAYENHAFTLDTYTNRRASYQNATRDPQAPNGGVEMAAMRKSKSAVKDSNDNTKLNSGNDAAAAADVAAGPLWDTFNVKPRGEDYHDDADLWFCLRRAAKVLTIGFSFFLILITGVMSKLSITLITTNLLNSDNVMMPCANCTVSPISQPAGNSVAWTWSLIIVICFPYLVTFLKHLWSILSFSRPRWYGFKVLLTALLTESVHSFGVVIFTTQVLPQLDMFHSVAIFLGLGIVPSLLRMLNTETDKPLRGLRFGLNILAFCGQITAIVGYPIIQLLTLPSPVNFTMIAYLLSLVLISVRWWPNYFDEDTITCASLSKVILFCPLDIDGKEKKFKYKQLIGPSSSIVQTIVNLVKIIITVVGITTSVYLSFNSTLSYNDFFSRSEVISGSLGLTPIYVAVLSICCALTCYYFTVHAIKSKFLPVFYTLPVVLMTPLSLAIILFFYYLPGIASFPSQYPSIRFNFLYSPIFGNSSMNSYWIATLIIILVWYFSQLVTTFHNWQRETRNVPRTQLLYLLPMFDGECLEQSLLFNRRMPTPPSANKKAHARRSRDKLDKDLENDLYCGISNAEGIEMERRDPGTTQLYFCATMWHENDKEMLLMLKSVLRMDFDHFQRRSSQKFTGKVKPDFYNFETHIFFDDAFEPHSNNGGHYNVNSYVKQLVQVVPQSVKLYYPRLNIVLKDPVKIPTPYGGRLEWELPSGSKLIAHLKDKMKIRHKKRWSQVMYMYYFLGELLMNNPHFSEADKEKAAKNTYLLALDGDVDFKPEAVLLLVDMMKNNERVGAACGRIHPIGSGPLIWYQKFEYAIAHWLQKATEHVLGCVLCSPGCFSLFRAEAVMADNVMAKYATVSTKARHYLQFDQGEDRWLCTLMLQAGYKVEYNAAADALTFAPEGFDEFFNQRRRWGPSTMANILDLIMDAQHVIQTNGDMSLLYIIYQAAQFFASIIGPGTIFMMVTGALKVAVQTLALSECLIINLIPNLLFIIISFNVKSSTQLKMAKLLAIIYALVMCLVLIAIIIDISSNVCSPTSIFFFTVAGTFIFSALLHPQEITCVLHGITYYALIPCMYMLLIVYSFININNVSWGTRETVLTPTEQQQAAEKAANEKAAAETRRKSMFERITSVWKGESDTNRSSDVEGHKVAFGEICQFVCCPKPSRQKTNEEYWQINKKLDQLNTLVYERLLPRDTADDNSSQCVTDSDDDDDEEEARDVFVEQPRERLSGKLSMSSIGRSPSLRKHTSPMRDLTIASIASRDDLIDPFWAEGSATGEGEIKHIEAKEVEFWNNFIAKFLAPLDKSATQQERVEKQLMDLRKNVNFAFFLTNAMFITIVYTLQENTGRLNIPWPCGDDRSITADPLSVLFLFFFILVLGIQAIGMVIHRLRTFWHIMASTKMQPPKQDSAKQWEDIVRITAQTDDDVSDTDTGLGSDIEGDDKSTSDPDEVDPSLASRNNPVRRSLRAKTKRMIRNKSIAVPAVTSLDEAIGPKLESLTTGNTHQIKNQLRKLSGAQRRKTVRFLRSETTAVGRQRFMSESKVSDYSEVGGPGMSTAGNRLSTVSATNA